VVRGLGQNVQTAVELSHSWPAWTWIIFSSTDLRPADQRFCILDIVAKGPR
jgi:hypothetical protein